MGNDHMQRGVALTFCLSEGDRKNLAAQGPGVSTHRFAPTGADRRMLTQIVERWGSLSDELKRAVLRRLRLS